MDALSIRSARADDIDAIMLLEHRGFHAAICESRQVMLQRLLHFADGFLILQDDAGNAIGYLCSELWAGGHASDDASGDAFDDAHFTLGHDIAESHHADGDRLYISSMTIHPDHRGGGFGRRFFEQSIALLRKRLPQLRESVLMLSAEWHGAQRIYQSCGYVEVMRLPGFFSSIAISDTDALVMKLKFF
jgi:ribosomal-protein-alanine N-acetyltransferase